MNNADRNHDYSIGEIWSELHGRARAAGCSTGELLSAAFQELGLDPIPCRIEEYCNELDMLDDDEKLKKYLEMPRDMTKVRIWRASTMEYEGLREFKDLEDCINTLLDENAGEAGNIIVRRADQVDLKLVSDSDLKWVITIYDDYIE